MFINSIKTAVNMNACRQLFMIAKPNLRFIHLMKPLAVHSSSNKHHKNIALVSKDENVTEGLVSSSKSPNELLSVINDNRLDLSLMVKAISKFGYWKSNHAEGIDGIMKDDRFNQLCLNMESEISGISSNSLIITLKNLLTIGLSSESYVIKSLEHELLWRIRKMSLRQISTCLMFHKDYTKTEQQREIVTELIDHIQKRWFDIHDFSDLIRILQLSKMYRDDSLTKILDRTLELVGDFNVEALIKLFCLLAEMKLRPTPLLRAIVYHIKQSDEKINVRRLVNITYAMHTLNFRDSDFLNRICEDLLPEISAIDKSAVISAFLLAFGNLQYCNAAVLEQMSRWIKVNFDKCRHQELCTYVQTMSRLNYVPVEDPSIMDLVISKLNKDLVAPKIWLDVVSSLVCIQKASNEHVASVLDPAFYRPLIDKETPSYHATKLKILNINAAAKFDLKGYSGPYVMYEPALENVEIKLVGDKLLLHKSTVEILNQIIPVGRGLATDIMTKMGFSINAEFIVDDNLSPSPLTQGIANIEMKGPQPLSSNLHRVAVLVWTYRDVTLNTLQPIGVNALVKRILINLGYKVVDISFSEVNERMTANQKLAFMKTKIQQAISDC